MSTHWHCFARFEISLIMDGNETRPVMSSSMLLNSIELHSVLGAQDQRWFYLRKESVVLSSMVSQMLLKQCVNF